MLEKFVVFIGAGGKMYKQMSIEEAGRFVAQEETPAGGWEIILIERLKQTYRGPLEDSPVAGEILGQNNRPFSPSDSDGESRVISER
jgi:hypothetical protein